MSVIEPKLLRAQARVNEIRARLIERTIMDDAKGTSATHYARAQYQLAAYKRARAAEIETAIKERRLLRRAGK